ncbi:MAG: hypothetical protein HYR88_14955 [Verrucomicrobia bacterium]|nr:hypothetical protein [Verrucomicrobiota bacterium]MBI3867892.1 hypothetical protein [Verrucomicrobiota bacterium]
MKPLPTLWVCFALEREARPLRPALDGLGLVRIVVTGMGARRTTESLEKAFAESSPSCVLTCGFAGGLSPEARHGDVLFETDHSSLSGALIHSGARRGAFHCADRIAITIQEKRELAIRTRADAVEMESGVIRRLCSERGIPSATLRSISDTSDEDLPLDFNRLTGPDDQLSSAKLAKAILMRPWVIPRLIALGRHSAAAANRLAACIAAAAPRLT